MAEYNIQMNRYVSASDSYDQLFPKTKTVDVVDQNGDNLDTLLGEKIDYDEKGAANGVASLGADGKVPSSQLPATGYSKEETLTAATAALYGLPNTAVPDDVFAWLGKYAEHCWRRRAAEKAVQQKILIGDARIADGSSSSSTVTVYYSQTVRMNQSAGTVELVSPQQISGYNSVFETRIRELAPCFFYTSDNSDIFYLPQGSTDGLNNGYTVYRGGYDIYLSASAPIKATQSVVDWSYGEWDVVFSTNRSAYPDSGIVDGYEYEYLGVPFENLPTAPKIETGSYVGTGTYGASNPNSLTFEFKPKVVFVSLNSSAKGNASFALIRGANYAHMVDNSAPNYMEIAWNENIVSWFSISATSQLNGSNETYNYVAIG